MKREYLYRWRITVDGPADTFAHYTLEDFRREFPDDCVDHPTPIEVTEWILQEPETPEEEAEMLAEEILAAIERTPNPYGPSGANR
jgi:hypothetical protein